MNDQECLSYLMEKIELDLVEIEAMTRDVANKLDLTSLTPVLRAEFEETHHNFSHFQAGVRFNSAAFSPLARPLALCVQFRKEERRAYEAYKKKLLGVLQAGGVFTKTKRARIDGKAKQLLEAWVQENAGHHPEFTDKCKLAGTTKLSVEQVSNWFVNYRNRKNQPTKAVCDPPPDLEKPAKRVCLVEEQELSSVPMFAVGSSSEENVFEF
jgi:hypothetical protein